MSKKDVDAIYELRRNRELVTGFRVETYTPWFYLGYTLEIYLR